MYRVSIKYKDSKREVYLWRIIQSPVLVGKTNICCYIPILGTILDTWGSIHWFPKNPGTFDSALFSGLNFEKMGFGWFFLDWLPKMNPPCQSQPNMGFQTFPHVIFASLGPASNNSPPATGRGGRYGGQLVVILCEPTTRPGARVIFGRADTCRIPCG